jgi:hypothetical protein
MKLRNVSRTSPPSLRRPCFLVDKVVGLEQAEFGIRLSRFDIGPGTGVWRN